MAIKPGISLPHVHTRAGACAHTFSLDYKKVYGEKVFKTRALVQTLLIRALPIVCYLIERLRELSSASRNSKTRHEESATRDGKSCAVLHVCMRWVSASPDSLRPAGKNSSFAPWEFLRPVPTVHVRERERTFITLIKFLMEIPITVFSGTVGESGRIKCRGNVRLNYSENFAPKCVLGCALA